MASRNTNPWAIRTNLLEIADERPELADEAKSLYYALVESGYKSQFQTEFAQFILDQRTAWYLANQDSFRG